MHMQEGESSQQKSKHRSSKKLRWETSAPASNTRYSRGKWLFAALIVSLLIHLLLTPLPELIGLFSLPQMTLSEEKVVELDAIELTDVFTDDEEDSVVDEATAEDDAAVAFLDEMNEEGALSRVPAAESEEDIPVAPTKVNPTPTQRELEADKEAEIKEKEESSTKAESDAGVEDAGAGKPAVDPAIEEEKLKKAKEIAAKKAESLKIKNQEEMRAWASGAVQPSEVHVRMEIASAAIREHPLGEKIGTLLRKVPQWNDFLGTSTVDPIRDLDLIHIAAPQLVTSSANAYALVKHHMPAPVVKGIIDSLVKRRGTWIRQTDKPAAQAYADRGERIFAAPSTDVLVIAPLSVKDQVLAMNELKLAMPKAGSPAFSASLDQPAKVMARINSVIKLNLAESYLNLKLKVFAEAEGSARLEVIIIDTDEEGIKQHAEDLQNQLSALIMIANLTQNLGLSRIAVQVDENKIILKMPVSAKTLNHIYALIETQLPR